MLAVQNSAFLWRDCQCQVLHKLHCITLLKKLLDSQISTPAIAPSIARGVTKIVLASKGQAEVTFANLRLELGHFSQLHFGVKKVTIRNCDCRYWHKFLYAVGKLTT